MFSMHSTSYNVCLVQWKLASAPCGLAAAIDKIPDISMVHQREASTYLDIQPYHSAMPYSMLFYKRA